MSCSVLAFLPPSDPAGAGPVKILTPEEIAMVAGEITPISQIQYNRRQPLIYWREPFQEPPRRKMGGNRK